MCLAVHVYIYIYMYLYVHLSRERESTLMCMYTCVQIYTYMDIHVYIDMYAYKRVQMCIEIHSFICFFTSFFCVSFVFLLFVGWCLLMRVLF